MNQEELTLVMKMRYEAQQTLRQFERDMKQAGGVTKEMADKLKLTNTAMRDAEQITKRLSGETRDLVSQLKGLAAGGFVLFGLQRSAADALRTFSQFQDGMSEVRKTSGLMGADLDAMKDGINQIAREVPIAEEKLFALAASAGRAGVQGKDAILDFTKTTAQMSIALDNVDSDALLRMIGNTTTPITKIKEVAAALNMLDDTSKTSADRIMMIATDIAAAGSMFDIAADEVMAWSTVLAESGVDAGIASTTILKMGGTIREVTAQGGKALADLAGVAGMTGEQFQQLAKKDMAEAINAVIRGLGQIAESQPGQYTTTLKLFELDAINAQKAINVLGKKYDELTERRRQAQIGSPEAMAKFDQENALQLERFSAQMQLLKNNIDQLKASIGSDLADALQPLVMALAEVIKGFNEWYNSLSEGEQKVVAFGAVATTAIVGVLIAIGKLGAAFRAASYALGLLGGAQAAGGLRSLSATLLTTAGRFGAFGLVVGGVVAGLAFLEKETRGSATEFGEFSDKAGEGKQRLDALYDSAMAAIEAERALAEQAKAAAGGMDAGKNSSDRFTEGLRRLGITAQWAAVQVSKLALVDAQNKLISKRAEVRQIADSGAANAGGRGGAMAATHLNKQRREMQGLLDEVRARTTVLNQATDDLNVALKIAGGAGPAADAPPVGGTARVPTGDTKPGGSKKTGGGSKTDNTDIDERRQALAEWRLEAQQAIATAEMLSDNMGGALGMNADQLEEERAVIDAMFRLRQDAQRDALEKGKELNAQQLAAIQLTEAEEAAIRSKVQAEQAARDAENKARSMEELAFEIASEEDLIDIYAQQYDKQIELLAVHDAINRAKREGRTISKDELELAKQLARTSRTGQQAREDSDARRDLELTREFARGRMQIGFGNTREQQVQLALLQKSMEQKRKDLEMSPEIIAATRAEAEAMYDINEAQQMYNEQKEMFMQGFDAFANAFRDVITGAKDFKSAIGDLLRSLADLVIQYMVLIPLKRAFEQSYDSSGGFGLTGGGTGGFFGSILKAGMSLFGGGGFDYGSFSSTVASNAALDIPVVFAKGGIMTDHGPVPLRKYSGGGIASSPQLAMFGEGSTPEAYVPVPSGKIPVELGGGGGTQVFSPTVAVTVVANEGEDPEELGRKIGDVVDARMSRFAEKQMKPGGMFYNGSRR